MNPELVNRTVHTRPLVTAMGGLCGWTTYDEICYATMLPLLMIFFSLCAAVIYSCNITPQTSVLDRDIQPHMSPFVPVSYRSLTPLELQRVIGPINDTPLKAMLPRIDLEYLVEPCATMGVASVRDLLRMNRIAQRDVGIGNKEIRVLMRALERRIKLREKGKAEVAARRRYEMEMMAGGGGGGMRPN